jgi:hypothetical protein
MLPIHQSPLLALRHSILAIFRIIICPFHLFFPAANDGCVKVGYFQQIPRKCVTNDLAGGCSCSSQILHTCRAGSQEKWDLTLWEEHDNECCRKAWSLA